MLENSGNISVRAGDKKFFRLKAVNQAADVYQRYIATPIVRHLSYAQIFLAIVLVILHSVASTLLQLKDAFAYYQEHETTFSHLENGMWGCQFLISVAATCMLWACKKPSYGKIHAVMAFNIIGAYVMMRLFLILHEVGVRGVSEKLYFSQTLGTAEGYYESLIKNETSKELNLLRLPVVEDAEKMNKIFTAALVINSTTSALLGFQIVVSIFQAFLSARAIFCGRNHLESKFFEMEAVSKENSHFNISGRNKSRSPSTESCEPPPAYVTENITPEVPEEESKA